MTDSPDEGSAEPDGVSRRALLSSVAATGAAAGLAGCSEFPPGGLTSVAATPVVLTPGGQELLGLSAFEFEAMTRTVSSSDAPADVEATSYLAVHGGPEEPDRLPARFDVGEPAAHALGALAMPAPDLLGQSLNPLADQPFPDLLTGEPGRQLISRAGVLDSPEFDWVRGPTRVGTGDGELLGTGTTAESYVGVVSDGDSTRTLLSQLTRVDNEEDVVLVGEFVWRATPPDTIETDGECADDGCQLLMGQLRAFLDRLTTGWGHVDVCEALAGNPSGGVGACNVDTSPPRVPLLSVTDVRVVQQVESTRVEETGSNPTIRHREPDPDLVRGENSAVVFEFDTLDSLDRMSSSEQFRIDVFSGNPGGNARYEREGTIVFSKGDLQDIAGGEHTVSVLHDLSKSGSGGNPVFELDNGDVKLSPRVSGYFLDSGVETTISVPSGDIRDVAPLRVGFIPLADAPPDPFKSSGDRYGDANGLPRVPLDTYRTMAEYLQRVYPGDVVTYLHQDMPFPGDATKALGGMRKEMAEVDNVLHNIATGGALTNGNFPNGGTLRTDGRNRSAVVSDIRQNGFDVTVAIVPGVAVNNSGASDYYDYHGESWGGVAFGANAAVSSVGAAPGGDGQGVSHTIAQEIGHFFQDNYLGPSPDHPMAQRRDSDSNATANGMPLDPSHARHKGSSNDGISGTDGPGVESVGYDLEDGFRNVQWFRNPDGGFETKGRTPYNSMDTVPSYMSYTGVAWEAWADARIHQQLIDTGTGGQWNAGLFGNSNASTMLTGTGRVDGDGAVRYEDVWTMEGYERYVDGDDNPVEVVLEGPNGEELVSARVPVAVGATHGHAHGDTPQQPMFALPFRPGGVRVRTTYEGRTTTMNPIVRSVRDAVRRVPDRGFAGEPDADRERIGAALEEVAQAMAEGLYGEAAAVMDTNVRDRIDGALVEYEAALDQRTPAAMADLLDRMVERLEGAR